MRAAGLGVAALLGAVLGACTITPNAASDAGAVDARGAGTIGDQCTRIYTALCQKDISACGAATDLNTCVTNGTTQCCGSSSSCGHGAITPDADIQACVDAVTAEDCNAITNNAIPSVCAGIPATQ